MGDGAGHLSRPGNDVDGGVFAKEAGVGDENMAGAGRKMIRRVVKKAQKFCAAHAAEKPVGKGGGQEARFGSGVGDEAVFVEVGQKPQGMRRGHPEASAARFLQDGQVGAGGLAHGLAGVRVGYFGSIAEKKRPAAGVLKECRSVRDKRAGGSRRRRRLAFAGWGLKGRCGGFRWRRWA